MLIGSNQFLSFLINLASFFNKSSCLHSFNNNNCQYMEFCYSLLRGKNFIPNNSSNLLKKTKDLFQEPIHNRQFIQSQVTLFTNYFNFSFDIPKGESYLNSKIQSGELEKYMGDHFDNAKSFAFIYLLFRSYFYGVLMFWN